MTDQPDITTPEGRERLARDSRPAMKCPFCGSEAEQVKSVGPWCYNCGLRGRQFEKWAEDKRIIEELEEKARAFDYCISCGHLPFRMGTDEKPIRDLGWFFDDDTKLYPTPVAAVLAEARAGGGK